MNKYVLIFSGVYLASFIAAVLVSSMFDLDGSFTVGTLMAGAMITSLVFVKDYKRAPNRTERRTLVWGSLLSSMALSSIVAAVYLLFAPEGASIIEILIQAPRSDDYRQRYGL